MGALFPGTKGVIGEGEEGVNEKKWRGRNKDEYFCRNTCIYTTPRSINQTEESRIISEVTRHFTLCPLRPVTLKSGGARYQLRSLTRSVQINFF